MYYIYDYSEISVRIKRIIRLDQNIRRYASKVTSHITCTKLTTNLNLTRIYAIQQHIPIYVVYGLKIEKLSVHMQPLLLFV